MARCSRCELACIVLLADVVKAIKLGLALFIQLPAGQVAQRGVQRIEEAARDPEAALAHAGIGLNCAQSA